MRSFRLIVLGFAALTQAGCKKPASYPYQPATYSTFITSSSQPGTSSTSSLVSSSSSLVSSSFSLTTSSSSLASSSSSSSSASASLAPCIYEYCTNPTAILEADKPVVSSLCSALVTVEPIIITATATVTTTALVTPEPVEVSSESTTISTTTTTITVDTACGGPTVTVPAATFVQYSSRAAATTAPARRGEDIDNARRTVLDLGYFASECNGQVPPLSQLSSACSCILTTPTSTVTTTVAATVSLTLAPISTTTVVIISETIVETGTEATCTSTSTVMVTMPISCGMDLPSATASSTGYITCASSVAAPSQNARHRIEGNSVEGTIFEDCVVAGPRSITTPSGGTHLCDGTNAGANPNPGTTITDQLDAASKLNGFPYDGTYDSTYADYFIESIGATSQTSTQFWGVLSNEVFTPAGGCQSETVNGLRSLWAFDAFNANGFLTVQPDYAVAEAGQGSVTIQIESASGSGSSINYGGASIAGQVSGSDGMVTIPIPSVPGCYQYKATAQGQIRSNAFYLNVYDQFAIGA